MSSTSFKTIFQFQFMALSVPLSKVWSDGPIFHSWLWIDAKKRLYCYETSPNTRLKHRIITRLYVFIVSKRDTHPAHSFVGSKFPTISASLSTFSRKTSNTILWILLTIYDVFTSFNRKLSTASCGIVLITATQYLIVVNKCADSPTIESCSSFILVGLRRFKGKFRITLWWPIFSVFTNS